MNLNNYKGTFIKLQKQPIKLIAINSEKITTPVKAVKEAIEFCIINKLKECELDYGGHIFRINKDFNLRELINDYYSERGVSPPEESIYKEIEK